jgi:hypothetical protein
MRLYVVMIDDRHIDREPYVFDTPEAAIAAARQIAEDHAAHPEPREEETIEGWLFYLRYGVEGDAVWVVEKTLNEVD